MKSIIKSIAIITAVAAVAGYGTYSYFSDTETSTGNTFTAGSIDLKVDSTAHYAGLVCTNGVWVDDSPTSNSRPDLVNKPCSGTWTLTDLGPTNTFFNLSDLKPGDSGENTISLHVDSNDAYVCAIINNMHDNDNGLTEPENDAGDVTGGPNEGDLAKELRFFAWGETDCNNVWGNGEPPLFTNLPDHEGPASDVLSGVSYPLFVPNGPAMKAGTDQCIGLYWCYGKITVGPSNALSCDGKLVTNMSQTDGLTADISFYVEQARNNPSFVCPQASGFQGDRPRVGSNFGFYQAPVTCDKTVGSGEAYTTIQAGVTAATNNQTVCVKDGTYSETVTINKPLTLASLNGPNNTATITGGVNIRADNVTVKGFKVNAGTLIDAVVAAFYIKDPLDNAVNNVVISDNDIDGTGSTAGSRGIINAESGTFSNVLIQNNKIHNFSTAVYMSSVNGAGDGIYDFTVRYNDVAVKDNGGSTLNTAGIGQLNEALVTLNEFTGINHSPAEEAVGAGPDYDGSIVSFNNFLNGTLVNTYAVYPVVGSIGQDIKAENNFWSTNGASQTGGSVDFTPEATTVYLHR